MATEIPLCFQTLTFNSSEIPYEFTMWYAALLCLFVPLRGSAEGRGCQLPRIISNFPGIGAFPYRVILLCKFVWGWGVLEIPKFHKVDWLLLFPSVVCREDTQRKGNDLYLLHFFFFLLSWASVKVCNDKT